MSESAIIPRPVQDQCIGLKLGNYWFKFVGDLDHGDKKNIIFK